MTRTALLAILVCGAEGFSAFGTAFQPGQPIPDSETDRWPEGTLETRLNNKSVVYAKAALPEGDTDPDTDDALKNPDLLDKMTVAGLHEFATAHYADYAESLKGLKKADLLVSIKTLIAEHPTGD
jgi:hypothetical protein